MGKMTLNEKIRAAAALLKQFGASEVYVFGSAAKGEMSESSDVDMAVKGLPPAIFFHAMGQVMKVLDCPVDLIDLDEETPFTRLLIEEGELVSVG